MTDPDELVNRALDGVRTAEQAGADGAEIYLWAAHGDRVMKGKGFQMAQESDQSGVCVRILQGDRLARVSTDGIAKRDIRWAIDRALASVPYVPESPAFGRFPDPDRDPGAPMEVHPSLAQADVDRSIEIADQLSDRVDEEPGIDYFEILFGHRQGTYALANSQGLTAWDRNAHEQCNLELRFQHEGQHKYTRTAVYGREPIEYEPRIRRAAEDAIELIRSTSKRGELDGGVSTVVFDPVATNTLVSKVVRAATGLAASQGRTQFADELGERVAVEELTLVDEPRNGSGIRQQRTDDEGIPTRRTPIIEDGVLESYLYDWAAAREVGEPPSGHGFRSSSDRHDSSPGARTCNLEIAPGDWTREEMVEAVDRGVLVKGPFLGSFTSSPVTGDFSLVAPLAFLIEGGQVRKAVPSTTVSGNLYEMLEDIRGVGRETVRLSNGRSVHLLVEGVTAVA